MLKATGWVCVLAVLSACGANITDPIYTAAKGTLSDAAVTEVKDLIPTAAAVKIEGVPSQVPGDTGASRFFSEFGDNTCVKKTPETTTDGDADGIFATRKVETDCSDIAQDPQPNGYENKSGAKGYVSVVDKDDSDKKGGYRFEFDVDTTGTYKQVGVSTQTNKGELFGFFDLTKNTDGGWTYSSNYRGNTTEEKKMSGRVDGAGKAIYEYGSTWNHTMTPDADPTTGKITFAGFYGFRVLEQLDGAAATKDYNIVLKATSENLTYKTTSCTNFFNGGSITFEDASGNKIKYDYTCSAITKTYNGTGI